MNTIYGTMTLKFMILAITSLWPYWPTMALFLANIFSPVLKFFFPQIQSK